MSISQFEFSKFYGDFMDEIELKDEKQKLHIIYQLPMLQAPLNSLNQLSD